MMTFNQSNWATNHALTQEEQMLTTCTLVLFGFCCFVPGILLGILLSTVCCQKQWRARDSCFLSSNDNNNEDEDDFDELSKDWL